MTCSIKFVRLDDFVLDVDSLDLMANGYSLADDGYLPVSAPDGVSSVHEVITLKLQGTSKDDLAAMTQDIDEKIKQVGWWLNDPGVEKYQVWIRVQLDGETYPRQAQILDIVPPDKVRVFTAEENLRNYIGEYSIAIERTPFWEGEILTPISKTAINALGGTRVLSAAIPGDVPARLVRLRVQPTSGSSQMSATWVGWKTSRFGTAANFVGRWGLNNGAYGTDTDTVANGTSSTGFIVRTTFGTDATLVRRTSVTVGNVSSLHDTDQRGTYLVLMRAKMSDTSVARARIAGSFSLGFPIYRSRQVISGTAWHLYEMGVMKIPPSRIYTYHNMADYTIEVDAERISGSGSLHMDCLVMIPIDDGAIKATAYASLSGSINNRIAIFQSADNQAYSWFEVNSNLSHSVLIAPQNGWGLPNDTSAPYIVVAASDELNIGSTNGATVDIEYTYATRWRTLRGNTA